MLLPVEALISMPLWFEDAPAVGDLRFPNPDVMRPLAGHGQRSEELPVEVVVVLPVFPFAVELFVFPAAAAFLAASSAAFFACRINNNACAREIRTVIPHNPQNTGEFAIVK